MDTKCFFNIYLEYCLYFHPLAGDSQPAKTTEVMTRFKELQILVGYSSLSKALEYHLQLILLTSCLSATAVQHSRAANRHGCNFVTYARYARKGKK